MNLAARLGVAAGVLLAVGSRAEAGDRLALGKKAPMATVMMESTDGKKVSIAQAKGAKGTLVIFTCNHCPWAKAWEKRVAELGNEWSKKGFGVLAINPNDPKAQPEDNLDEMKARAKTLGLAFPYTVDATSDVARAFGATKTPEVFLFDAKDELVYHGAIDDNAEKPEAVKKPYLRDALAAVAAGQKVPQAETKAIGCSIKFRS